MKIAFIIYGGMTTLDFIGVYDPVTRLKTMGFIKDLTYDVCSDNNPVISAEGLEIIPDKVKNDLSEYDYIIVPGGEGIKKIVNNDAFLSWLKSARPGSTIASVCGGSIILGLAGMLKGRKATTHPALMDYLRKFTPEAQNKRLVQDENIITARGVTSSIDLGLYLCEKIAGPEVRVNIQKQMDYLNYAAE